MPVRDELQKLDPTELARHCNTVARRSSDSDTREAASKLHHEWAELIIRRTSSPPSNAELQRIKAEQENLKKRMINFLAELTPQEGVLPFDL